MDRGAGLRGLLEAARAALADGASVEAERKAKALSAIVRAERDVAEFIGASAAGPEENEQQLRRRIARFVEAASAGAPDEVLERIATGASAG